MTNVIALCHSAAIMLPHGHHNHWTYSNNKTIRIPNTSWSGSLFFRKLEQKRVKLKQLSKSVNAAICNWESRADAWYVTVETACIPPRRCDHNKPTCGTSVVIVWASRTVWFQVLCESCYASGLLMDKEIIYLSIDIAAMPIYLFDVNRISIHLDFVIKFELPFL